MRASPCHRGSAISPCQLRSRLQKREAAAAADQRRAVRSAMTKLAELATGTTASGHEDSGAKPSKLADWLQANLFARPHDGMWTFLSPLEMCTVNVTHCVWEQGKRCACCARVRE